MLISKGISVGPSTIHKYILSNDNQLSNQLLIFSLPFLHFLFTSHVYSYSMSIKKFLITSFIISLFVPIIIHAQVKITEIMYDPAGSDTKREWIEVLNIGTGSIDLSTYFFFENNVYHKLVAQSNALLGAGSYAIIVDSIAEVIADYTNFMGQIFDSTFSLNNTGEPIVIANPVKETIDTFTYTSDMGANNDGNSLQINDGIVITAMPTFGLINKTESETPEDDSGTSTSSGGSTDGGSSSSSNTSTHEQQTSVSNYTPTADFKIGAGRKRFVSLNTPVDFEASLSKNTIKPRYIWNFGDFNIDKGRKTTHIYEYPGIYEVVLEGKTSEYTAISRTEIRVIEPELDITEATTTINVHNKSKKEMNLGGFKFVFSKGFFEIPRNTIIAAGATLSMNKDQGIVLQSFKYPNGEIYVQFDTIEGVM